jgi:hypothetical protein
MLPVCIEGSRVASDSRNTKRQGSVQPWLFLLFNFVRGQYPIAFHASSRVRSIRIVMPEKRTLQPARRDARQGKAASTQAGEFVREEIHHIRQGKHGAASAKQAIAIGLSKARRAGVKLKPPARGRVSEKTRRSAASAYRKGQRGGKISPRRSRARLKALRGQGRSAVSHRALARQARSAAARRRGRYHHMAGRKAARTRSQRRWRH